jgi:hypothetical protein
MPRGRSVADGLVSDQGGCNPNTHDNCVGFLTAGTHSSVLFEPGLTCTVSADWANHEDSQEAYVLFPTG